MTQRQHTFIAIVLVLTGLLLVRIASPEVQPWDEGLYAIRTAGAVEHGEWFDQTPYTVQGLYSSTPPPFVVWLSAPFVAVMGPTTTALRLPVVLCSGICLALMLSLLRRSVSQELAILGICIMSGCLHWALYSRQLMTEVPLMMWLLLAMWAAVRWYDAPRTPWWIPVIYGAAFGMGLLTKMSIGMVALLFVMPMLVQRRRQPSAWLAVGGSVLLGLCIAAPWYMMMMSRYGESFWHAMLGRHAVTAIENNTSGLGPLYYVNQLLGAHALFALLFVGAVAALVRRSLLPQRHDIVGILGWSWFVVMLLVFGFSVTKNIHYTVLMIPAAVITTVSMLDIIRRRGSRRLLVFGYAAAIAALLWILVPAESRVALKSGDVTTAAGIAIGMAAAMLFATLTLPGRIVNAISVRFFSPVVYGITGVMIARVAFVVLMGKADYIHGGRDVAKVLQESAVPAFTYLYHKHTDGDATNPQLAWYLRGWMTGALSGKTYTPLPLMPENIDAVVNVTALMARHSYIVYYHPGQTAETVEQVQRGLAAAYIPYEQLGHYTVYERRTR